MSKNKNSAAFQEFLKFKEYILGKFLEKFGGSYDNVENLRDRWFHEYAYTADAEQFLIDESRFYLRICSNPREIKFLNTLTTHMADYLSVNSGTPEAADGGAVCFVKGCFKGKGNSQFIGDGLQLGGDGQNHLLGFDDAGAGDQLEHAETFFRFMVVFK